MTTQPTPWTPIQPRVPSRLAARLRLLNAVKQILMGQARNHG